MKGYHIKLDRLYLAAPSCLIGTLLCLVYMGVGTLLQQPDFASFGQFSLWDLSIQTILFFVVLTFVLLVFFLKTQLNVLKLLRDILLTQVPLLLFLVYFYKHVMAFQGDTTLFQKEIFILGVIISVVCFSFTYYRRQILEVSRLRKQELEHTRRQCFMEQARLQVLQAQLKPHFFFNNLSVLSSLIDSEPKNAKLFLQNLSNLYRHVLANMDKEIIPLSKELDTVFCYTSLLEQRYGKSVIFNLPDASSLSSFSSCFLPPLSIQQLIENSVKHNARLPEKPLVIDVVLSEKDQVISVKNNLNPLASSDGHTGTGLANLAERYRLLKMPLPSINSTSEYFEVILPLIKEQ